MLLVYSPFITPRIRYIFRLILSDLFGLEINFISDKNEFLNSSHPKINYSRENLRTGLFVEASELLFEKNICEQKIEVFDFENGKAFFKTSSDSVFPFDLFAASFYLVSRYEEYLPFKADEHGRYTAEQSMAYKNNFLNMPLVNIWANYLKQKLQEQYPSLNFKTQNYSALSTIDVDNVFAYKGKGLMRTAGAYVRDILKFDFEKINERTKVLSGNQVDPFDHYNYQRELKEKYKIEMIYFLLCASTSQYDNAVSPNSSAYKRLVNYLNEYAEVGLHPSYISNEKQEKINPERQLLSTISKREIIKSRQHFLKLNFPDTYRSLIQAGIKKDYSMGYTTQTGFRASICSPFNFYDLGREEEITLQIFPFAVMDFTLCELMKLSTDEAISKINSLIDEVKKVNGIFISVWHDRTFSNKEIFSGWNTVYEKMIKSAK